MKWLNVTLLLFLLFLRARGRCVCVCFPPPHMNGASNSVVSFVLSGLRRLQQDRDEQRTLKHDEQQRDVKRLKLEAKALREAVRNGDNDRSLYATLCEKFKDSAVVTHVIQPEADPIHINRMLVVLLKHEAGTLLAELNVLKNDYGWRDASHKQVEQQLQEQNRKYEVLELKCTNMQDKGIENEALMTTHAALKDTQTSLFKARDRIKHLEKCVSDLSNAHQARMHAARDGAFKTLNGAHQSLTTHLNERLEALVPQVNTRETFIASIVPHVDAMRLAVASNLI
jgi:hypothetical protein